MKRVLITGAGGFVGQALARALCTRREAGAIGFDRLTLLDRQLPASSPAPGVRHLEGDVRDANLLRRAIEDEPDTVFHLAGLTSRAAEDDFAAGLEVNVQASMALFALLRAQAQRPAVVFTSSIGVFGTPLPDRIDDDTAPAPTLSYGTEKRMVELLLADYSRRGWLRGLSVRLPGVVARPAQPGGALSAFASDLIRELAQGREFICPVAADATLWFLSLHACVDNLLHAASVATRDDLPGPRAVTLPALRARVDDMVAAIAARFGAEVRSRIHYQPDAALQAQFANWPPLATPLADGLGFVHDKDLDTLVIRALETC